MFRMPHGRKKTSGVVLKIFASLCHLEIVQVTKKNNLNGKGQLTFLPPATKLGQGYIFTGVSDSVHGGCYPSMHCRWYPSMPCSRSPGGDQLPGGLVLGGCLVETPLVCSWGALVETPPATAAGSTHPTGMHSCEPINLISNVALALE